MALPDGKYDVGNLRVTFTCPRCKHNLLNEVTGDLAKNACIRWSGSHVGATCGKYNSAIQMSP